MDENKDNVMPIKPHATAVPAQPLTTAEQAATQTAGQKVSAHFDEHKAKYIAGIILSAVIALLQAWPTICPTLPGVLSCAKSQAIVNQAAPLLKLGQDLLKDSPGGGGNE